MKYIKILGLILVMSMALCGCNKQEESDVDIVYNETNGGTTVNPQGQEAPEVTAEATKAPSAQTSEPSDSTVALMDAKNSSNFTIVIDAGHQGKGNPEHEPIGPGATETKPKVSDGTTGVASKVPEYKVTLQVSKKIESLLKNKGYNVIMVRDSHDVNMSNAERAKVANDANADVFIRIHCNGAENASAKGALTMCQTKNNPYCGQLYSESRALSQKIVNRICEATGANNKGILESDTMSGINWCSVPVSIIEMGFMSNKEEDLLLVNDAYQDKMAVGICNGVIEYLNSK